MTFGTWVNRLRGRRPIKVVDPAVEARLRARDAFAAGDAARDAGDWNAAAGHYAVASALDPNNMPLLIQFGHALKETGRLTEAEGAYRRAAQADLDSGDASFQLGHMLKLLGRREDAIDAYAEALTRQAGLTAARDELIAMGARGRIPGDLLGPSASAHGLTRLASTLEQCLAALQDLAVVSIFPVQAYDAFRRTFPIRPCPPSSVPPRRLCILIQAIDTAPSALRDTLVSLLDQQDPNWIAVIQSAPETGDHPVAAFGRTDPRIRFAGDRVETVASALAEAGDRDVLMMSAGTVLDREALGWLGYALERTGAAALYTDHDHYLRHWRSGLVRQGPVLQSMPDRDDLVTTPLPPALLAVERGRQGEVLSALAGSIDGPAARRTVLTTLMPDHRVAHLPRILAGVPVSAVDSKFDAPAAEHADSDDTAPAGGLDRILVIIPTRDQANLLDTCLISLKQTAAHPDRIDILVLDNRSVEPETTQLLARLAETDIQTRVMDEPFNWSRFNNLGAADGDHAYLVFANNDIEMLTRGWDTRLRAHLDRAEIGVVGARMSYPDGTLQHAGVVLGGVVGRPFHEGSGVSAMDGGPLDRWHRSHLAAAVTGAFMACRREAFVRLGGFDEALGIAYNDMDFCLRARAASLGVLYAADIEMIHHESKTRGLANTTEKVAWDDSELCDVYARWGDAFFFDPGVNPQWSFTEANPYDGYRDLTTSQILAHLDLSARARPWSIDLSPAMLPLLASAR